MQMNAEARGQCLPDPKVILLLEDDPTNGWMLQSVIQRETPYYALLAANGMAALKLVQSVVPNLILLDYALPDLNGLQVYEQIKAQPGMEHVPAILVTAWPDRTEVRASHLRCVAKPYDLDTMLEMLHQQLDDEKSE